MSYKSNLNKTFEDNKPVYGDTKTPIDVAGQEVSLTPQKYSIDGEIIELQKRHYGNTDASQLLDRSFSELTKTKDSITPETFFNLYRELFYDIPKIGEDSHVTLMLESKNYISDYTDPKDNKIDELIAKIVKLESEAAEITAEHPIFPNGTAIRIGTGPDDYSGPLGIMQEGRLRGCSNQKGSNSPSPFAQLKKPLGFIDSEGVVLKDKDCFTFVSQQVWDSLPKWPDFNGISFIDSNADLNLNLSQLLIVPESKLSELTTLVQTSKLKIEEIKNLMRILGQKIPFEGYRLEDNYETTPEGVPLISYSPSELRPFNEKGEYQGQIFTYDTVTDEKANIDFLFRQAVVQNISYLDKNYMEITGEISNPSAAIRAIKDAKNLKRNNEQTTIAQDQLIHLSEIAYGRLKKAINTLKDDPNRFKRYSWNIDPLKVETTSNYKFYWIETNSRQLNIYAEKEADSLLENSLSTEMDYLNFLSIEFTNYNL